MAVFDEAVNNGWIDAFPRQNKRSGGYTISTYGEHPYILLNFDGTFEFVADPSISRRPKQNFFVQIKGTGSQGNYAEHSFS